MVVHEVYGIRLVLPLLFISGSFGAAVSLVAAGKEQEQLSEVEQNCNTHIRPLPGG